jgi:hypothetical protein
MACCIMAGFGYRHIMLIMFSIMLSILEDGCR